LIENGNWNQILLFQKDFVSIPFQAFKVSFLKKKSFHSLSALVSLILFFCVSQAYCFLIFVQAHFPSSLDFQAVFFSFKF